MNVFFARLEAFLKLLSASLGVLIVLVAFLQVVSRYVLGHAFTWPEEICGFLFMWCSLAGIVIATSDDAHLRIDALVSLFSKPVQTLFLKAGYAVLGVFSALMVYLSACLTWDIYDMEQQAIAVPIPIWVIVAGLPVAFFLNTLFAFRKGWAAGRAVPDATVQPFQAE